MGVQFSWSPIQDVLWRVHPCSLWSLRSLKQMSRSCQNVWRWDAKLSVDFSTVRRRPHLLSMDVLLMVEVLLPLTSTEHPLTTAFTHQYAQRLYKRLTVWYNGGLTVQARIWPSANNAWRVNPIRYNPPTVSTVTTRTISPNVTLQLGCVVCVRYLCVLVVTIDTTGGYVRLTCESIFRWFTPVEYFF